MGRIANIFNDGFNRAIAGGSLVTGGGVGLATGNPLFGAIVAVSGTTLGMLFRPRSDEEIAKLTQKDVGHEIMMNGAKALMSGDKETLNKLLRESENAGKFEKGAIKDENTRKIDLSKAKSILNRAQARQGMLGKENLQIVGSIISTVGQLIEKPEFLNSDISHRHTFDGLLHTNLPETMELFYKTDGASTKESVRKNFAMQLDTLRAAFDHLLDEANAEAEKALNINGHYLTSKLDRQNSES